MIQTDAVTGQQLTEDTARIAVPVAASADLGDKDQKGVVPPTTNGFGTVASVTAILATPSIDVAVGDSRNEFQLGVELGPTWRTLGGDIGQQDSVRRQIFGTEKSSFVGFELTFFAKVNAVQPFARFSNFARPDGVIVNGFTGRQIV